MAAPQTFAQEQQTANPEIAATLRSTLANASRRADFSADVWKTFQAGINHCRAGEKGKLIADLVRLIGTYCGAQSPQPIILNVEEFRSIARDLPLDDKKSILRVVDEQYANQRGPMAMKWLSVFSQIADNRPARDPVALRIPMPTDKQLDCAVRGIPSPASPELQSLYSKLAYAIDAGEITKALLNEFYAVGIDVEPSTETRGRENLDSEQKTQLIRELIQLHNNRVLPKVSIPRPTIEDVEKLRAIAKGLDPEQHKSIKAEHDAVFKFRFTFNEFQWSTAFCQILGQFPIHPFNTLTHQDIGNIPGHAFSTVEIEESLPKPRPVDVEIAALRGQLEKYSLKRKFPSGLLDGFCKVVGYCTGTQKISLISELITNISTDWNADAPPPTPLDVKRFRAIGATLSLDEKKSILRVIAKQYGKYPGSRPKKWLSVFVQMTHNKPMREPIAHPIPFPTEKQMLTARRNRAGSALAWEAQMQLRALYNELAPAVDANAITRELLNKFYAEAKNLTSDLKTEVILELMQFTPICRRNSTALASKMDVEQLRAIAVDLDAAQRQSIRAAFDEMYENGPGDQKHLEWAGVYCQILDPDVEILEPDVYTVARISGHPRYTFFGGHTQKATPRQAPSQAERAPSAAIAASPEGLATMPKIRKFSSNPEVQSLYEKLNALSEGGIITNELLNQFYAVTEKLQPKRKKRLILQLMQATANCHTQSAARASTADVEKLRVIAMDLDAAQRQSIKDAFKAIYTDVSRGVRQSAWASAYCQMLDPDFDIIAPGVMTVYMVSKLPGHTFFQ